MMQAKRDMLVATDPVRVDTSLFRLLVDNLPNSAAALYDSNLRIICAGGELLPSLGLPQPIEGRHISELVGLPQTELLTNWFTAALSGQPMTRTWPSGEKLYNITVRRARGEAGTTSKPLGVVIVQDLQALTAEQSARLDEQYERAAITKDLEVMQTKARVIERILHEFRNPLAAAGSSADLLDSYGDAMPPEKRRKHVRIINEEVHRIAAILDNILSLVK